MSAGLSPWNRHGARMVDHRLLTSAHVVGWSGATVTPHVPRSRKRGVFGSILAQNGQNLTKMTGCFSKNALTERFPWRLGHSVAASPRTGIRSCGGTWERTLIEIDFEIRQASISGSVDWTWANEMLLRYDCFLGNIRFVVDDVDLSMDWGWIPILDFALSLQHVVRRLMQIGFERMEFTDSDCTIEFRVIADDVLQIQSSYLEGVSVTGAREFREKSRDFFSRVRRHIEEDIPEIRTNESYLNAVNRESE